MLRVVSMHKFVYDVFSDISILHTILLHPSTATDTTTKMMFKMKSYFENWCADRPGKVFWSKTMYTNSSGPNRHIWRTAVVPAAALDALQSLLRGKREPARLCTPGVALLTLSSLYFCSRSSDIFSCCWLTTNFLPLTLKAFLSFGNTTSADDRSAKPAICRRVVLA